MHSRRRGLTGLAAIAAVALAATACGGGSSGGSGANAGASGGPSSSSGGNGASGTPVRGGTLNMLGTGDVQYLDPNIMYYSVDYQVARMFNRQLFAYSAQTGKTSEGLPKTTQPAADIATDLPTTDNGGISKDGKTYTITIKQGVNWDTTPPRQVEANDVIRGLIRACNPTQPNGGLPDFEDLIVGYKPVCDKFVNSKNLVKDAKGQADFVNTNMTAIPGLSVGKDDRTLVIKLVHPATYFTAMVAGLMAFSPAPVEYLSYLPISPELYKNLIATGPYKIQTYNAAHEITLVRNPAWNAKTDDIRHAYVDKIDINETGNQESIQQQLETNTPTADLYFDTTTPAQDQVRLLQAKDPRFELGFTSSSNPYVVFNFVNQNSAGPTSKLAVRQALEYGINRSNLIQDAGGPKLSPPLDHVLPPSILGSKDIHPYNYDVNKAKSLLASAGYTASNPLKLKLLYRSASNLSSKMFATMQADLKKINVELTGNAVPPPTSTFYDDLANPSFAKANNWDLALAGWGADWFGNGAPSFFLPLFYGQNAFPPSGSNFGFYTSAKTNALIQQAVNATSENQATDLWAKADKQVMDDAAFFPITVPNWGLFHAAQVNNTIYLPALQGYDATNVWLDPAKNGG